MGERNQERMARIHDLDTFLSQNNEKLDSLLGELGWNMDTIQEAVAMETCPINEGHRVPAASLDKHVSCCKWLKEGYSKKDMEKQIPSSHFYYKNSLSVVPVLIDQSTQAKVINPVSGPGSESKVVPKTMERASYDLTTRERLAVYDYVVDITKKTNKQSSILHNELAFDAAALLNKDKEKKPLTHKEMLAELRDYKRRRQSYRGKNVHITKKSQTEVMREVIEAQMELIGDTRNPDDNSTKTDESQSGNSRSPSRSTRGERSQSPDRWRSHDRRQRSPRREHSDDMYRGSNRERNSNNKYGRKERERYSEDDYRQRDYDRHKRSHHDERPRHQHKHRKYDD